MKFLDKNKWFLLAILLIGLGFYWFQYKPSVIRTECYSYVLEKVDEPGTLSVFEGNNYYRRCLVDNGMKPEDIVKTK